MSGALCALLGACAGARPVEDQAVAACTDDCGECAASCATQRQGCEYADEVCDLAQQRCELVCRDGSAHVLSMVSRTLPPAVPLPEATE